MDLKRRSKVRNFILIETDNNLKEIASYINQTNFSVLDYTPVSSKVATLFLGIKKSAILFW